MDEGMLLEENALLAITVRDLREQVAKLTRALHGDGCGFCAIKEQELKEEQQMHKWTGSLLEAEMQEKARLRAAVEWATDLLWNSKVTFRPNHMAATERENCVCIVCDETAFAYELRRKAGLPPREGEEG